MAVVQPSRLLRSSISGGKRRVEEPGLGSYSRVDAFVSPAEAEPGGAGQRGVRVYRSVEELPDVLEPG